MTSAVELVKAIRADLRDIEARIRGHRWVADLESGGISAAGLAAFAGEQLAIIPSDLRSFEALAARITTQPAHGYFTGMAAGERAALEALAGFAAATSVDPAAYEPIPGCQAYPSYVARLARDGTAAEVAGAFLVNLEAWGANCARMHRALTTAYWMAPEECAFFAFFAAPTDELERDSLAVIDAALAEGADPRAVATAARMLQAYELLYWDSLPA